MKATLESLFKLQFKIMIISLIAAIGKNNELGKNNALLWRLPADLKHFKETTYLHPVIMGRKTYESIGRSLPDRRNIVITRDEKYKPAGIETVKSIEKAIALFENSDEEIFFIGGGEIYSQAIQYANKLYITKIDNEFREADTFFPAIDSEWKEKKREDFRANEKNPFNYSFIEYEK